MNTPHEEKNIRLTISVSPEVHATFKRLSKGARIPIGRAMGEWLLDTLDAAAFTAQKMEEARAAPALVTRQLHAYALGLADETLELMHKHQVKERPGRPQPDAAAPASGRPGRRSPPSSNTGG